MTVLWADSFDHYGSDAANALRSGWNTFAFALSSAQARTGPLAVRVAPISTLGLYLKRAFAEPRSSVAVGAAYRFDAAPVSSTRTTVARFNDSGGTAQVSLTLSTAGFLQFRLGGSDDPVIATADRPVTFATWQHIESKLIVANAGGGFECRLNGQTVISVTGDTQASGTADVLEWLSGVNASTAAAYYLDDVIAATDFVGDMRVHTLFPDADTPTADFAPDSGATGYARIAEAAPDGDSSFIATAATSAVSLFGLGDLPAGVGAIAAVIVDVDARKTDAGTCTFRSGLRSGVATANGAAHAPGTSYAGHEAVYATDPATGAPWTKAGFDAAQLKLERLT